MSWPAAVSSALPYIGSSIPFASFLNTDNIWNSAPATQSPLHQLYPNDLGEYTFTITTADNSINQFQTRDLELVRFILQQAIGDGSGVLSFQGNGWVHTTPQGHPTISFEANPRDLTMILNQLNTAARDIRSVFSNTIGVHVIIKPDGHGFIQLAGTEFETV